MTTPVRREGREGRITDVDALRGFALFGIAVANSAFFASGYAVHLATDPYQQHWYDTGTRFLITLLVDTKFYLLFAFLFGYSFTLQMNSSRRAGVPLWPRVIRRCVGLGALGAAHAILLFHGDILTTYAVLGLGLLAMKGVPSRTVLIFGVVLTAAVCGSLIVLGASGMLGGVDLHSAPDAGVSTTAAFRGGWTEIVTEHLSLMPLQLQSLVVQAPLALSAMLVGLCLGRRRLMERETIHVRAWRWVQIAGFTVGLSGGLTFALGGGTAHSNFVTMGVGLLSAPFLAAAYTASLILLLRGRFGRTLTANLSSVGRMALSNYLGQSACFVAIFTGVGAGLVGRLAAPAVTAIAVLVFAVQVLTSRAWLQHHRYGPAEWLLRWLTNARRPSS